jgi:hypothetical protein
MCFWQSTFFKEAFLMLHTPKKMFVGHIKVLGGQHVARKTDVAQACSSLFKKNVCLILGK